MKWNLQWKLFVAIFSGFLLTILILGTLVQYRVQDTFDNYLTAQDQAQLQQLAFDLARYYEQSGSLAGLKDSRAWRRLLSDSIESAHPDSHAVAHERMTNPMLRLSKRIVLFDRQRQRIQGTYQQQVISDLVAIETQTSVVGYVAMIVDPALGETLEKEFTHQFFQSLLWIFVAMLVLALVLSAGLARYFGRPILALRATTQALSEGQYENRILLQGNDELTALANDINLLAERLGAHEQARKQWVADVAHELRTPLTILKGEIEALEDGILPAEPATWRSLTGEINQLQHLINDLYQLAMSDSGVLQYVLAPCDFCSLLSSMLPQFTLVAAEKQVQLSYHSDIDRVCLVMLDEQRMKQVLTNLFENSLRYTQAPGVIRVTCLCDGDRVQLFWEDSLPSVPDEALAHLFDRLYRVDASRNRASGGAVLGLSLCKAIVEHHQGDISASHSALGGLSICVRLPMYREGSE